MVFQAFFVLAVINSILSIAQFAYMEQLGFTTQMTSGIFGFHGTGTGAMFSVVQSALSLHIFIKSKKKVYFMLTFFISIPIVTGYDRNGFGYYLFRNHINGVNPVGEGFLVKDGQ